MPDKPEVQTIETLRKANHRSVRLPLPRVENEAESTDSAPTGSGLHPAEKRHHFYRKYRSGQKLPGKMPCLCRHPGRGWRSLYHRHGYDQPAHSRRGRPFTVEKTPPLPGAGSVSHRRGRISSPGKPRFQSLLPGHQRSTRKEVYNYHNEFTVRRLGENL